MTDQSRKLQLWWEGLDDDAQARAKAAVQQGSLDPATISSLTQAGIPVESSQLSRDTRDFLSGAKMRHDR